MPTGIKGFKSFIDIEYQSKVDTVTLYNELEIGAGIHSRGC